MPLSGEASTNLQARPCSTRGWKRGERGEREKEGRKGEGYTSEAEDGSTKRSGTRGKQQQPTTPLVEGTLWRFLSRLQAALSDRSTPPRPPRLLSLFLSSSSSSSSCCVSRRRRSLRRGKRRGRVGRLLSATLHLILRALRRP